jgi:chemotaxis protein MotB
VVTIVTDQVLFETGKADLRPLGAEVLDAVAPVMVDLTNRISIEGHTDNVPISGARFASNWELSAQRATTVLRYTIEHHGIAAARLSAAGFADTQPLASNDTPEGRSKNRRVEIVILSSISQDQLGTNLLMTTNGRS